jgi:hypothetical protein
MRNDMLSRLSLIATALAVLALTSASASSPRIPPSFTSAGADHQAIAALLDTYKHAVSTKNRTLFETLLLNKTIPFTGIAGATSSLSAPSATAQYLAFAHDVFDGPAFTQRFQDVHIDQDGPLAAVSLVFVNSSAHGSNWGWKTLQLLKVDGQWKIASEFYTGHPG